MSPVAVFTRNIPEGWSCDATANLKDLALEQICSVLNLHSRTVDLEAGFLELGGHSLSAIDLVSGCRSHGVHISVENILLSDTIAEILDSAEWLEPLSTDTENGSPPPYPVHKRHAESLLGASKKKQCKTTEDSISSGVSSTGHASPMTEMQLVFVQGSQANPETNTISFYDSYQTKDIPVMKRAWQSVIESESIFRTTFKVTESSGPMIENTHAQFNWMDTVVHNREDYEKAVEEDNPTGEVYTSFNVVTWLKERQETTYSTIVWRVHHAFIDGFSAALVYQKVRRAAAGFPIHAGTPFIQVANKLQELQHANRSSCQRFWKCWRDSSSSAVGDISLPPPTSTRRLTKNSTKSVTISIPVDQLQESARTTNVSVVSIYYAAWAMVLSKYNDSDSVVFGVVLSGRNLPLEGVEDSIGPLVNTIPLHVLLDRSWTTRQYMRHIFKALVKLSSVQYSPSTENFKRDFSSALATEFEMDPAESDGVRPIGKSHFTAVTDVPLSVYINSDNKVRLCYHCDLFNKKDIERLGQNYHSALLGFTGTVDSVGTCMDHILLNESRSLLRQVGNFLSDSTRAASVHDDLVTLFEHAVSENPLNVAVEKGAEWLTYHGLNTKADLVMKHRSLHTRPGDVVCVNADRSLTWIIAIYGILKAGCVYSPLDKALPTIVRDTNFQSAAAKIFLVSRSSEKDIKPSSCKICLAVEELLTNPAPSQSAASIRRSANPAANAYVCFTSGSAGKPKGVMCTHQGLVAFQRTLEVRLFAQPGWKISQIMGPAFDGSIHEIFSALSYGATLVLPDSIDPVSHLRLVDEAILTPSLAQKLSPNDFPRLGALYLVGEPVTQPVNDTWSAQKKVYNMYGPTEGTGGATIKKLLPGVPVTIGAPNPSSRIYILDRNQSLVPPGVAGEIYLAGVQVARGYIGRPDETSNRFFPDHVLGEMGERMYKTGDRGYWNAEGEIICIGRNDRQIKLRGFRLDLNDLEIRIAQAIPGLTAVAVAQREDYLVAMIQPSSLDVGHVKSKIADILQVYAMPRVIAAVDEFPLTPIGKIDYKRVAEIVKPKVTKSPPKQSISASETMLISAWREPYSWPQMLPSTVIPISPTLEALRSLSCFWPVDLASCSGTRYHTERLLRRRRYGSSHRRLMSSKAPKMRLALHLFIRRPH